jgi:hypothetical protein
VDLLPVVTFILGQVFVLLLAFVQNRWANEREKESVRAAREETQREFQRQTLLDLQTALYDLGRAWGRMFHEDDMTFQRTGKWGENQYSEDWSERENEARLRVAMYTSRVRDAETRANSEKLQRLGANYTMVKDSREATSMFIETIELLKVTTRNVGEVLRTL